MRIRAELNNTFKPLGKLIGTGKMNGRTLDSNQDNIFGEITIQPILGGTYLELRGTFSQDGDVFNGGWRPDEGEKSTDKSAYDLTMTRV